MIKSDFDIITLEKWDCPKEAGPTILTMPNIPKPLHNCLRGDAEVLTNCGWKRIDSITINDTVATWDMDTEKIIWDHPTETIKTYSKQMVRIKLKNYKTFGMLVTPEHRIPIRKQTDGRVQINGVRKQGPRKWTLACTTAAKLNVNAYQHLITAARNGSQVSGGLTDLERVYISIQADGSLRHKKNNTYSYRVSFKKDRKKERFESICKASNVDMTKYNHGDGSYNVKNGCQGYGVRVCKDCKNFWNCFDITSFSKEKAQQFIDEISLWDGSCEETCGILNRRYVTTKIENAKFAQAVAVIAGVTSSFQISHGDDKCSDAYIIDFLDRDYRATQGCLKEVEEFEDYAYCINVPTSYFVVRDADTQSVMITGNCAPRTLLGATTWNYMRKSCYANANDTCEICGYKPDNLRQRHGHELYSIDYANQTATFERCVCLCYRCHCQCIHTGRALTMYKKGSPMFTKEVLLEGAEHAFTIIHSYNEEHEGEEPLRLFSTWLDYMKQPELKDDMERLIKKYDIKFYRAAAKWEKRKYWGNWKLIIGNKEYKTPYENFEAWKKAMEKNNIKQYGSATGRGEDPFKGEIYDEIDKILKETK